MSRPKKPKQRDPLPDLKAKLRDINAELTRAKLQQGKLDELIDQGGIMRLDNDPTDQQTFYELAQRADFPDQMGFELSANPESLPHQTFSMDGINSMAEQMRNFMLARLVGYGDRTGKVAKHARFVIEVKYDDDTEQHEPMSVNPYPFYTGNEKTGVEALQVDGLRRLPTDKPFS